MYNERYTGKTTKWRSLWLAVNLATVILASMVIAQFEVITF